LTQKTAFETIQSSVKQYNITASKVQKYAYDFTSMVQNSCG